MTADVVQLRRRGRGGRRTSTPPLARHGTLDATAPDAPLVGLVRPLPLLARWYKVDDWGRDESLIRFLGPLARLRWDVSVGGAQHVPDGAALLVHNSRRFSLSAIYASWALADEIGRPVRFVGRPDIAPVGPLLRRLGALLLDPDEVAGALRNGEVVLVGAAATGHPRLVGGIDHELLTGAVLHHAPVLPVVTTSTPLGRAARVEVGAAVPQRRRRRGPLAEVELAEDVRRQLQKMLDELGGTRTGVAALDWLGDR